MDAQSEMKDKAPAGFWGELWLDLGRSVYDVRCFADLSGKGLAYAAKFLAVLIALSAAAETAVFAARFLPLFNRVSSRFVADVAQIAVKDGKLSVDVAQPYVLEDREFGRIVIDTTGATTAPGEGGLLITGSAVISGRADGGSGAETRELFSGVADMEADRGRMREWCSTVRGSIVPLIGFFAAISHVIRKAFHVLWLAAAGFLYVRARGDRELPFSRVLSLSVYCLTAPVGLAAIVVLSGVSVPGFGLAYMVVSFMYAMAALTYILRGRRQVRQDGGAVPAHT